MGKPTLDPTSTGLRDGKGEGDGGGKTARRSSQLVGTVEVGSMTGQLALFGGVQLAFWTANQLSAQQARHDECPTPSGRLQAVWSRAAARIRENYRDRFPQLTGRLLALFLRVRKSAERSSTFSRAHNRSSS
jgi:hypothetical protein